MSRYKILGRLGEGGMGVVYRALQEELGREVAIKFLRFDGDIPEDSMARFALEIQTCFALDHPHIVRILDVGMDERRPYYTMELLEDARTLDAKIRKDGPLPAPEAARLLDQLLDALAYVHEKGFVHRDVKPRNLMLRTGGDLVLMDFGLVKALEQSRLTVQGKLLGTPAYMPPEVLRGGATTGATDVYAAGAVLYEMLAGRSAFRADNLAALARAIVKGARAPVEPMRPGLPPGTDALIDRLLATDLTQRVTDAARARVLVSDWIAGRLDARGRVFERKETPSSRGMPAVAAARGEQSGATQAADDSLRAAPPVTGVSPNASTLEPAAAGTPPTETAPPAGGSPAVPGGSPAMRASGTGKAAQLGATARAQRADREAAADDAQDVRQSAIAHRPRGRHRGLRVRMSPVASLGLMLGLALALAGLLALLHRDGAPGAQAWPASPSSAVESVTPTVVWATTTAHASWHSQSPYAATAALSSDGTGATVATTAESAPTLDHAVTLSGLMPGEPLRMRIEAHGATVYESRGRTLTIEAAAARVQEALDALDPWKLLVDERVQIALARRARPGQVEASVRQVLPAVRERLDRAFRYAHLDEVAEPFARVAHEFFASVHTPLLAKTSMYRRLCELGELELAAHTLGISVPAIASTLVQPELGMAPASRIADGRSVTCVWVAGSAPEDPGRGRRIDLPVSVGEAGAFLLHADSRDGRFQPTRPSALTETLSRIGGLAYSEPGETLPLPGPADARAAELEAEVEELSPGNALRVYLRAPDGTYTHLADLTAPGPQRVRVWHGLDPRLLLAHARVRVELRYFQESNRTDQPATLRYLTVRWLPAIARN